MIKENKNKTLKKAREEMTYLTGDAAKQRMQELEEKWEMDRISETNYAREEGRKEGEADNKKQIAKRLLSMGMKIEDIAKATELTEDEIKKLQ